MAKTPLSLETYRDPAVESRLAIGFAVLLTVLVLLRLPHLGGPIDEPHSVRQCDTAQYAIDFYRHGFDLLHPAVNWMGAHRVVVLEFPLPEALMAAAYRVAGPGEDRARVVALLFFAGGVWYFFLVIRRLADSWTALASATAYAVMPLAWYYSRALVIDFFVLFFAYAWAYHWLQASDEESAPHFWIGTAMLALGILIKAPLFVPLGPPMLAFLVMRGRRRLPGFLLAGALATVPFLLWRWHTGIVNQSAPDWYFLPNYIKYVGKVMETWYFGTWEMRGTPSQWLTLGARLFWEMLTPLGLLLFLAGSAAWTARRKARPAGAVRFLEWWMAGSLAYLLLFFPLNVIHDYYQLPLLGPTALGVGTGLEYLRRWGNSRFSSAGWMVYALLAVGFAGGGWLIAEKGYYQKPVEFISAGRMIDSLTPSDALLVVSYPVTDCRDPRLLYFSRRAGWSVPLAALSPKILEALRQEGAGYLAILAQAPPADKPFLPPVEQEVVLSAAPWTVWLYRLDSWPTAAGKEKD